jgi:HAD superfamily hydrolase (TIGR01549 family)
MIKAVLFDLWNTLALSSAEWRQAYDEAGYHKNKVHDAIFEEKINTRAYVDEEELAGYMCSLFGGLDKARVKELLIASTAKFFPDVHEGIEKLKEDYVVGIVSNTHNLEIKKLDFSFADLVILSSEVGLVKPDKRIFDLACKELGVKPEECVFVGDNPVMDFEGSKNAGMKPVLIDRKNKHPDLDHVKDLFELIERLKNE